MPVFKGWHESFRERKRMTQKLKELEPEVTLSYKWLGSIPWNTIPYFSYTISHSSDKLFANAIQDAFPRDEPFANAILNPLQRLYKMPFLGINLLQTLY